MLDHEDRMGLWFVLGGLLALFGVGVLLTKASDIPVIVRAMGGEDEIAKNEQTIHDLEERRTVASEKYKSRIQPLEAASEALVIVRHELAQLEDQRTALSHTERKINSEIEVLNAERRKARDQVRARSAGLKYPELRLRNGKTYQDVTIRRITSVGLDITHRDGIARVHAPELSADLQDRFCWDDTERERVLREEQRRADAILTSVRRSSGDPDAIRAEMEARTEQINALRKRIRQLNKLRFSTYSREYSSEGRNALDLSGLHGEGTNGWQRQRNAYAAQVSALRRELNRETIALNKLRRVSRE